MKTTPTSKRVERTVLFDRRLSGYRMAGRHARGCLFPSRSPGVARRIPRCSPPARNDAPASTRHPLARMTPAFSAATAKARPSDASLARTPTYPSHTRESVRALTCSRVRRGRSHAWRAERADRRPLLRRPEQVWGVGGRGRARARGCAPTRARPLSGRGGGGRPAAARGPAPCDPGPSEDRRQSFLSRSARVRNGARERAHTLAYRTQARAGTRTARWRDRVVRARAYVYVRACPLRVCWRALCACVRACRRTQKRRLQRLGRRRGVARCGAPLSSSCPQTGAGAALLLRASRAPHSSMLANSSAKSSRSMGWPASSPK